MKIAMSLLSGVGYGGKTYFNNMLPRLARIDTQNEYHIFLEKGHPLKEEVHSNNFLFHECVSRNQSALKRFLWEQVVLPWELWKKKVNIIFTAKSMNIFFAPCKTMIAIRNMEPFFYKEYDNHWKLNLVSWVKYQFHKLSIKKADMIVAVSQAVKDRVVERFPEVKDKVFVVYNGNPIPVPVIPDSIRNPARTGNNEILKQVQDDTEDVQDNIFLLTASKFVAYANQLNLLKGYKLLCERRDDIPPLWFAGGIHDKTYFEKCKRFVKENNLEEKVKFLGLVPQEELFQLYRKARVFVFPSTLESCPHTLIEVMACGAPIATAIIEPMPEICGSAAVYFEAYNPEDIAQKIEMLLDNEERRTNLRENGLRRAKSFTWEKTARGMIEVFNKIV